jgi:peptidyl-prolyl cis-trans isomerase SurA
MLVYKSVLFLVCFLGIVLQPILGHAKLLDKILAVVDDRITTLSDAERAQSNILARRNISPALYSKENYSIEDVVKTFIQTLLVRSKLAELGYNISDDQVEQQIKETENKLRINREALLQFLTSKNMNFDEYFELIRSSIEYSIFENRVIIPMVSVTEQEIKNFYYKGGVASQTQTYKYNLLDFSISAKKIKKDTLKNINKILEKYQRTGHLPEDLREIRADNLGEVNEDGLTPEIIKALKNTNELSFSQPVLKRGQYHFFFVKKKEIAESEKYSEIKSQIRDRIFQETVGKMTDLWLAREKNKHYIVTFF